MRIIVILALVLSTNLSFAQIGTAKDIEKPTLIGTSLKSGSGLPRLEYYNRNGKKTYSITYRNLEYENIKDIKSIEFEATDKELEYLYNFFKESFGRNDRTLKVGNATVLAGSEDPVNMYVFVYYPNQTKGWFYLGANEVDRLFGKLDEE